MAIFRIVVVETVVDFVIESENNFHLMLNDELSSIDYDDDDYLDSDINDEDNDDYEIQSHFEYEEMTLYRINRSRRSYEEILSILIDEFIDESSLTICAAAA